jgi:hypothetical protein
MTRALLLIVLLLPGMHAWAQLSCTVHYDCGSSSQCARVMGGYKRTVGPFNFSSESDCLSQARKQMTNARCTCTSSSGARSGASGTAAATGSLYTGDPSQTAANVAQNVLRNVNPQTNQQWGMAIGGAVGAGLLAGFIEGAMQGPTPQQLAAREAARQEQARLQAEAAERKRLEDEARHRSLVAGLRGTEGGGAPLSLRREGAAPAPASNLDLLRRDGPLTPFPQGSVAPADAGLLPPNSNLSLLRRGDDSGGALGELKAAAEQGQAAQAAKTPEEAANRASQVFDTPLQQKPVVDLRDPQPIRADNATPITGAGVQQGAADKPPSVNPTPQAPTRIAAAPSATSTPKPAPKPAALPPTAVVGASAPSSDTPVIAYSPPSAAAPAPRANTGDRANDKVIDTLNALARSLGWSQEELDRLNANFHNLGLSEGVFAANPAAVWATIMSRPSAQFAALAAQGRGPGLPGAGQQTRFEDCAVFALANATGEPYDLVAGRAAQLIQQATYRPDAQRANPQLVYRSGGLNGGEVIMLAEAFGRADTIPPGDFAGTLSQGRNIMVNLLPSSLSALPTDEKAPLPAHQVVLTRTFQHEGTTWYEMMDSHQGPVRRLYLTHAEMDGLLLEKGIAYQRDSGRTPALLR